MIFAALALPLMLGALGLIAAANAAIWHPSSGQVIAELVTLVVLVGVVFVVAAIAYPRRKLRPLLAALPTTEERITYRQQTETIARNLPRAMLGVGLGFGVLITLLSTMSSIYETAAVLPRFRVRGRRRVYRLFCLVGHSTQTDERQRRVTSSRLR